MAGGAGGFPIAARVKRECFFGEGSRARKNIPLSRTAERLGAPPDHPPCPWSNIPEATPRVNAACACDLVARASGPGPPVATCERRAKSQYDFFDFFCGRRVQFRGQPGLYISRGPE
jgi:hypothetical protein